jgi:hypothetical protein
MRVVWPVMITDLPANPLFFMHIPRTGGVSLLQYLDQKFPRAAICPAHEMFEFEQLKQQNDLSGYSSYRGHFGIDLPRQIDPNPCVITFLRRPIARVFSIWRHLRSHAVPFQQNTGRLVRRIQDMAGAARSLEFEGFCHFAMEHHGPWFFNSMTVLCTQGRNTAFTDVRSPHDLLEDAKRSIDGFFFVGFTETFNQSVAQMQRRFAWPLETIAHANAAPAAQHDLDGKLVSWLAAVTETDDHLYDYAFRRCGGERVAVVC